MAGLITCRAVLLFQQTANIEGNKTMSTINTTSDLKTALKSGSYAWPGGYPQYFLTDDGEALSFETVKEEYRLAYRSTRDKCRDGWQIVGVDVNWENHDLLCAHSGERIDSAYDLYK